MGGEQGGDGERTSGYSLIPKVSTEQAIAFVSALSVITLNFSALKSGANG